jgi:hypothetical protein
MFARRGARGVGTVRWIRVSLLGAPKLAGTDCLDVRKGEVLVVVQVVNDLVVHCVKGTVVGGFERVARMTDRNTSAMVRSSMSSKLC